MHELILNSILSHSCYNYVWEENHELKYAILELHCNFAWIVYVQAPDFRIDSPSYKPLWWWIQGRRSDKEMRALIEERFPKHLYVKENANG